MRATITAISAAALLAAGAGSAAARPADTPIDRSDAAVHARAMRSQGLRDLTTVASPDEPARVQIVRVTRAPVTDGGFDWADAGIGAGLATALLLSAAGVVAVRRQPPTTAS